MAIISQSLLPVAFLTTSSLSRTHTHDTHTEPHPSDLFLYYLQLILSTNWVQFHSFPSLTTQLTVFLSLKPVSKFCLISYYEYVKYINRYWIDDSGSRALAALTEDPKVPAPSWCLTTLCNFNSTILWHPQAQGMHTQHIHTCRHSYTSNKSN